MDKTKRAAVGTALLLSLAALLSGVASARPPLQAPAVRVLRIAYVAHDGRPRHAYLILPAWYGPQRHPPIPFVISPHGRGVGARINVRRWGNLPAIGPFAVINPEGQGRALTLFSWGDPGEIRDLAHMPEISEAAVPWLRIDRRQIYAFGGSMGGQETLLLAARFPHLLAGAASFDAPTDMAARYRAFDHLRWGDRLQRLARREFGGTPAADPRAYEIRSPLDWARQLAFSRVPLQIWWSTRDTIVDDQEHESGLLYRDIKRLNPQAPARQYVGTWAHTTEMKRHGYLQFALAQFGLAPPTNQQPPAGEPSAPLHGIPA
jgi:pimeloyl-ACP methyl ester carboxylesterase